MTILSLYIKEVIMNNKVKVNHLDSAYEGRGTKVQGYAIVVIILLLVASIVYNIVVNGIPNV